MPFLCFPEPAFQILNRIDGKYGVKDILLTLSRTKFYPRSQCEITGEVLENAKELADEPGIDRDVLRKNDGLRLIKVPELKSAEHFNRSCDDKRWYR